jgi:hypothetical protein
MRGQAHCLQEYANRLATCCSQVGRELIQQYEWFYNKELANGTVRAQCHTCAVYAALTHDHECVALQLLVAAQASQGTSKVSNLDHLV